MQQYKNVTLSVDIINVAGISFPMTISRHITFGSTGKLDSTKHGHILKHCKALIGAYANRDFNVTIMLTDNQFEPLCGDLADLHAHFHTTSQDEHVPKIKQYNLTTKDRVCSSYNRISFGRLPPITVI